MEMFYIAAGCLLLLGLALILRFNSQRKLSIGFGCTLVLVIGSVFGRDFFAIESGPVPLTFDRMLLVGLFGWFAIGYLRGTEDLQELNWLDLAILVWVAIITFSTITHDWKYLKNMPASRLLFFNLMPVGLYFLARNAKLQRRDLILSAGLMVVFGLYLAFTAVAEVKGFKGLVFPKYILASEFREFLGRGRGPFLNPVSNGLFLMFSLCCALSFWPKATNRMRILVVAVSLVLVVGVYSTLTRSNWLALVIACAWFIFLPSTRPQKGLMLVVATVVGILAFPIIGEKVFSFKRDKYVTVAEMQISAKMRPMFAEVAWDMFRDRPLWGVGFGQYGQTKDPYLRDGQSNRPLTITRKLMQHNVFLAYLTETGVIGVVALSYMLAMMFAIGWGVWKDQGLDLTARQFGLIGVVCLSCYVVNGTFHDVSLVPQGNMLLFLMAGLVNNIKSRRHEFVSVATTPNSFSNSFAELSRTVSQPNLEPTPTSR